MIKRCLWEEFEEEDLSRKSSKCKILRGKSLVICVFVGGEVI